MKIILIMGLPGAGKTTLANELAVLIKSKRLNADEIRKACLLYTSPSPRDGLLSRMPSSA